MAVVIAGVYKHSASLLMPVHVAGQAPGQPADAEREERLCQKEYFEHVTRGLVMFQILLADLSPYWGLTCLACNVRTPGQPA